MNQEQSSAILHIPDSNERHIYPQQRQSSGDDTDHTMRRPISPSNTDHSTAPTTVHSSSTPSTASETLTSSTTPTPSPGNHAAPLASSPCGPLNYNIIMGPQLCVPESSTPNPPFESAVGGTFSYTTTTTISPSHDHRGQLSSFFSDNREVVPPALVLPTYRPRTRKVHTKEVAPQNDEAVRILGMSPFMIGKDAMSNQNRLVGNEAIFTKHFLTLKQKVIESEATQAKRAEEIYVVLAQHKALITSISGASTTDVSTATVMDNNPDFNALAKAHAETRDLVDQLRAEVSGTAQMTRSAIEKLEECVKQLTDRYTLPSLPTLMSHPTPMSRDSPHLPPMLSTPATGRYELPAPAELTFQRKRPRSESHSSFADGDRTSVVAPRGIASSSRTLPQITVPRERRWQGLITGRSRSYSPNVHTVNNATSDVIYGPIPPYSLPQRQGSGTRNLDFDDDSYILSIAHEAVSNTGLRLHQRDHSPLIESVRYAHGNPDFLNIRFSRSDYAAKFFELVRQDRDGSEGRREP